MRLWLTRPRRQSHAQAAELAALGIDTLIAPLIEIDLRPRDVPALDIYDGVIVTSSNAFDALAASSHGDIAGHHVSTRPIYVVGPATAAAARRAGFQFMIEGAGTAAALAETIVRTPPGSGRHLLYLAGADISFDLASSLRNADFTVDQRTVYAAEPAPRLPPAVGDALSRGDLHGVVLMSARTAQIYSRTMAGAALAELGRDRLEHYCLSDKVAAALASFGPCRIAIPAAPNMQEMLALLAQHATSY